MFLWCTEWTDQGRNTCLIMLSLQDLQLSVNAIVKTYLLELRSALSVLAHNSFEKHCQYLLPSLKVQCTFAADSNYFKPSSFIYDPFSVKKKLNILDH